MHKPDILLQPTIAVKRRLPPLLWFLLLYLAGFAGLTLMAMLLKALLAVL